MKSVPSCVLPIKVIPNAPRTQIVGKLGDFIKIKLKAPPVDGKANAFLLEFLAERLSLPRSAVSIQAGEKSRCKKVFVAGLDRSEAESILLRDA